MSQENVEIVRAVIDAWNRGDWDAALSDTAEDFEYDLSRALGPFRGIYRRDQVKRVWADFTEGLTSARIEPHEFIEAGAHVVVPWSFHAVGRDSVKVHARLTWVWTVRDGTIERASMYQGRAEALEAAGVSE